MANNRKSMNAQLTPIFPSDLVSPGVMYFARLDNHHPGDINSWWIVLRCSEELLPRPFLDIKDPQARAFPFWIIGRDQFIWLERNSLHILHPSQKDVFARTGFHDDFAGLYDAATGAAKGNALNFFERDIKMASERYVKSRNQLLSQKGVRVRERSTDSYHPDADGGLFLGEEEAAEDEGDGRDNNGEEEEEDGAASDVSALSGFLEGIRQRKRQKHQHQHLHQHRQQLQQRSQRSRQASRAATAISAQHETAQVQASRRGTTPRNTTVQTQQGLVSADAPGLSRSAPARSQSLAGVGGIRIKTEAEENQFMYSRSLNAADQVRLFVGGNTHPYVTNRGALTKSAILESWIQRDEAGMFVMHPRLNSLGNSEDFLAVLDFMQRGQYQPNVVKPRGHQLGTPMALAGRYTPMDYSNELVRAGRLHLLGKAYQIEGFNAHILRKVTTTQYRPYSFDALITFASIIFNDGSTSRAGFLQANINSGLGSGGQSPVVKEPMEQWTIYSLAENFRSIMDSKVDREAFWIMEKQTATRKLLAEIFAKCADNYRRTGGFPVLPVVIED